MLLDVTRIRNDLCTRRLARQLTYFSDTTSTMNDARRLYRPGDTGVAVVADVQSAGRGRRGHQWISPKGRGLYLSCVIPFPTDIPIAAAGFCCTLALMDVLEGLQIPGGSIKWPNDVLIHERKVAGILVESLEIASDMHSLVAGIGCNVTSEPEDFPLELQHAVTSLSAAAGHPLEREPVCCALLQYLEKRWNQTLTDGFESLQKDWQGQCATLGRTITLTQDDILVQGVAEALEPDGSLRIRKPDGTCQICSSGDVSYSATLS